MKIRRLWAGAALIAAAVALLLFPALFGAKALVPADGIFLFPPWGDAPRTAVSNYLLVDQFLYLHPFARFLHDNVAAGRFPLWNPLLNCGVPFIASMQTAALFPINLLLSPIDPFYASGWAAFLKLFLAGMFMLLYVRGLGVSTAAAAFSGVSFALSGYMLVWLGHPHVNCAMWLPLLFLLIDRGLEAPKNWVLFALACACMLLGGHPATALHILLACTAYFFWRARPGYRYRDAALFVTAAVAGALLAAPQLLPFLEYVGESSVTTASEGLARWQTRRSAWTLLHFLQPYLAGAPTEGFEGLAGVFGYGPHENFNERTGFVGVLALILAAYALRFRFSGAVRYHAAQAAFSLAAILGMPPIAQAFHLLPLLQQTSPGRLSLFACFSLAVLAGVGLDGLAQRERPRGARRFAYAAAAAAAGMVVLSAVYVGRTEIARRLGAEGFLFRQTLPALGGVLAAVLLISRHSTQRTRLMRWACAGWAAMEMLMFGMGLNPAVPRAVYYPKPEAVRTLEREAGIFRVLGLGGALPANTGMMYGLQDIRGQDFMSVRRYEELITGWAGDFHFYSAARVPPAALAALNVRYAVVRSDVPPPVWDWKRVHRGKADIYRVTPYHERALVVYRHEVLTREAVLARMTAPGFDPAQTLLLEEEPPAAPPRAGAPSRTESVRIAGYGPDAVAVEAALPRPGFLLLLDTYYPGWRAEVNGTPAPLLRADYNFRAVPLPAGRSTVVFSYEPASFRIGVLLACLAAALLMLIGCRVKKA